MDTKTIERLLIDRKLGELPPDAETLLDAYLDSHPEQTRIATDIDTTIEFARRALARSSTGKSIPAMPPMTPAVLPPRIARGPQRWRRWTHRLGVAAAILVAFLLGDAAGPTHTGGPPSDGHITKLSPKQAGAGGFWSVERLQQSHRQRTSKSAKRIEWDGLFTQPRIGERT